MSRTGPPSKSFDVDDVIARGRVNELTLKKLAIESWQRGGPDRLVKVAPLSKGLSPTVGGYVTQAKFVLGHSRAELLDILGFPKDYLDSGAIIEQVWGSLKSKELRNLCHDTLDEVANVANDGLDRIGSDAASPSFDTPGCGYDHLQPGIPQSS